MKLFCKNLLIFLFLISLKSFGQLSSYTVTYKITFDAASSKYTVWVVPEYNVPNSNNDLPAERGGTAQVTLALPSSINITALTDVNGNWQKPGSSGWLKIGPNEQASNFGGQGLDANTSYYVIGKSPSETDYGSFKNGVPVALFTFTTSGCSGPIRIISPNEPLISIAINNSLNVANSFYSLSGQPSGGNVSPAEQFRDVSGSPAACATVTNAIVLANNENTTTNQGSSVTLTPLSNDTYNSGSATTSNVTFSIISNPSNGTAAVQGDGSVKYTPNASFTGQDCYTYKICDKVLASNCSTATDCITVTAVTPSSSISANSENTSTSVNTPVTSSVLNNDLLNGGTASISNVNLSIASNPSHGNVQVLNGTIVYMPNTGYTGQDCYMYKICDKNVPSSCSTAQNCVTISCSSVSAISESVSVTNSTTNTNVLSNDKLNGNQASFSNVNVAITSNPSHGTATVNSDGSITFTANSNYSGLDAYSYSICDKSNPSCCATTTNNVTVTAVYVPPVASCNCFSITIK